MKVLVFALHGFLGQQADWDFLRPKTPPPFHLLVPDYTQIPGLSPVSGPISSWGAQFVGWKQEVYGNLPFMIVGYSQGGRLGLMAMAENDPNCLGGIIISSSLSSSEAQEVRLQNDQRWAQRFLKEDFNSVVADWDAQAIFANSSSPQIQRNEDDFNKELLSECLKNWSLALQPDLHEMVQNYSKPLLWITGSGDEKYIAQSEKVQFKNEKSKKIIIPKSGHRVLHDNPQELAEEIKLFLCRSQGMVPL